MSFLGDIDCNDGVVQSTLLQCFSVMATVLTGGMVLMTLGDNGETGSSVFLG